MKLCPQCRKPMGNSLACAACGHAIECRDGVLMFAPGAAHAGRGYDPVHYEELARLESRHFWFRARNRLIVRALGKYFPHARSLLEIGCGTGMVLQAVHENFPGLATSGSDLFVEGLPFARARLPRANLMQMDATRIPFTDEFDVIGAFDVVEHIDDDRAVLHEIHRAIVTGGGAVFTVPQHPWLWSFQDELACHVRRYRCGELEGKLRESGFRVVYSTSFVTLLLPLMAASRRRAPKAGGDPYHELRVGGTVNAALYAALTLEYHLLQTGLRLPAGGSRLVVAIKDAP